MSKRKNSNIMGYNVFCDDLKKIQIPKNGKKIINTLNPHSYVEAKKDPLFQKALHASDMLMPDGTGIAMASKFVNNDPIERIAGADLHKHLLELLNAEHGRCFYMGSTWDTLEKIKERLDREYPNIDAGFHSPPFKEKFTKEDNEEILAAIHAHSPDVLFIGMTAPKQEKWLYEHKDKIDANIICSIGAVFDFYAGTIKRPSEFWQKRGLEWLPRLVNEPRRLWKRNFVSTPKFLFEMMLYKVKKY
ncbi:WecB/TagA/CpsF family glycosyltransferase [Hydrogenimonas urashimensis]|uniref:WecB/TagA/CpsF family glycosyltransferase n=1 Tax=Hydrogenimonas urashimensis TaxID=2740515 RepID=UPI0019151991|nr:WecB/TagA/CpsF family glycosyltransferase [Hydrogenimonas urashimensis]